MILRPPSSVPEIVADQACRLAGAPVWHPVSNLLYWTDAHSACLYSYDPGAARSVLSPTAEKVLQVVACDDGSLLLFTADGALKALRGTSILTLVERLPLGPGAQIDAAAADRQGRLYCAVRSKGRKGSLYLVHSDGAIEPVPGGAGRVCGLSFDSDGGLLYCCDAVTREISCLAHDSATGALSSRAVVHRVPESLGAPRGIAADAKGFVWVAVWGGSCIIRLAPTGKEERRVYFTARLLSGVTFGGPDLRDLYVVASGGEDRKANGPGAGALYRLRAGVKGASTALVPGRLLP